MKKKLFITLGILIIVMLTSAVTYAVATGVFKPKYNKPSDYKVGIKYEEALKGDKPILALFYVDWCGYCMRFMPSYKTIEPKVKENFNVVMINAEDPAMQDLVKEVRLTGYPTLYILDPKYNNRVFINQAFYGDIKTLKGELDMYANIRKLLDAGEKCAAGK